MNNCFSIDNKDTFCLKLNDFNKLQFKIKEKFNLNKIPNKDEIYKLLNIKNEHEIQYRIKEYFDNDYDISIYFKDIIDPINKNGLNNKYINNVFKRFSFLYKDFHYTKFPCFTDMENLKDNYFLNFMDFENNKPFPNNKKKYYLTCLNIKSTENVGHWTGIYCSLNSNIICYYDSLNGEIHISYKKLISKLQREMFNINKITPFLWRNTTQTQFYNKYCGVYQIHFLTTLLHLDNKNKIDNNILKQNLETNINEKIIEQYITPFFYNEIK